MNWRAPKPEDEQAQPEYVIDIIPDVIPHQVGEDGDAIVRISRPGWRWWVKQRRQQKKEISYQWMRDGYEEHRAAAIAAALEALAGLRQ